MQVLGKHRRYPARSPAFFAMNEAACTNKEASKPLLKYPSKFDHTVATPRNDQAVGIRRDIANP